MKEINPFIVEQKIDVLIKKSNKTTVNLSNIPTGDEITHNPDIISIESQFMIDKAHKVNLYMTPELRVIYMRLSEVSHKLLRYVEGILRYNEDIVHINVSKFMNESLIKSRATYSKGVEELCRYGFITPTLKRNKYWINPIRFFNGDRLKKYSDNLNTI